jgi:NAD(P)-dependent dehydrogenase (short-subunit alcohol dehydrogenase family)
MARGLALAGASVIIVGRNVEKSSAALRQLQSLGVTAWIPGQARDDML